MNKLKRFGLIVLAAAALALTACGSEAAVEPETTAQVQETETTTEQEETTVPEEPVVETMEEETVPEGMVKSYLSGLYEDEEKVSAVLSLLC